MSAISTHILNLAAGLPARGVPVTMEFLVSARTWRIIGEGYTNADSCMDRLLPNGAPLQSGAYRLTFDAAMYFRSLNMATFYPQVPVVIGVRNALEPHHLLLLLGPFGYTAYRGS